MTLFQSETESFYGSLFVNFPRSSTFGATSMPSAIASLPCVHNTQSMRYGAIVLWKQRHPSISRFVTRVTERQIDRQMATRCENSRTMQSNCNVQLKQVIKNTCGPDRLLASENNSAIIKLLRQFIDRNWKEFMQWFYAAIDCIRETFINNVYSRGCHNTDASILLRVELRTRTVTASRDWF